MNMESTVDCSELKHEFYYFFSIFVGSERVGDIIDTDGEIVSSALQQLS